MQLQFKNTLLGGFSLLITLLLVSSPASAQQFAEGYQGALWGMTGKQVRSVYSRNHTLLPKPPDPDRYYFVDTVYGMECQVSPRFIENALHAVMLKFFLPADGEAILKEANRIKAALDKRYGEVIRCEQRTPDVQLECKWKTNQSYIRLKGKILRDQGLIYLEYSCVKSAAWVTKRSTGELPKKIVFTETPEPVEETVSTGVESAAQAQVERPRQEPSRAKPEFSEDEDLPEPGEQVTVDEMPVVMYEEEPIYPDVGLAHQLECDVHVEALVDKEGFVRDAIVPRPTGLNAGFEDAAIEAALRYQYQPATRNGEPVAVWVKYTVEFRLNSSSK